MSERMSAEKQAILNHIWAGLHENGQTARAAEVSRRKFNALSHQSFDTAKPDAFYTELARQVVVTNTAAARKEKQLVRAFPFLLHASEAIVETYPLAYTKEEAQKRAVFWNASSTTDYPPSQVLRDTLHTLRGLLMMNDDNNTRALQNNVLAAMQEMSTRYPSDRFALIGLIEEAPLEQAREAYEIFMEQFAPASVIKPPGTRMLMHQEIELKIPLTQLITVASRFIGREIREKKLIAAHNHRSVLHADIALYEQEYKRKMASQYTPYEEKEALQVELNRLQKLVAKEQFAGVFRPVLDTFRTEQWRTQLAQSPQAYQLDRFSPLQTLAFAGLSATESIPLSHQNR